MDLSEKVMWGGGGVCEGGSRVGERTGGVELSQNVYSGVWFSVRFFVRFFFQLKPGQKTKSDTKSEKEEYESRAM